MELHISESAEQKVGKSILISGSARSGTTILGKLIHSLDRVEYLFEPPLLFSLMAMIRDIPPHQWKLLFETYLYEDFFINALSGRSINCNRNDDSSIYHVKSNVLIEERLSRSISKVDAEAFASGYTIAWKMPDIVPFLPKLQEYYPDLKILIMKREAVGTINSLLAKKWFADESRDRNLIWPYRLHRGFQVPYWVSDDRVDSWVEMNEIDRCAYYYIRVNEDVEKIHNKIEIDYGRLLSDPLSVMMELSEKLGLVFGEKTREIISQVHPTTPPRDTSIVEKISPALRERIRFYSSQCVS